MNKALSHEGFLRYDDFFIYSRLLVSFRHESNATP